MSDTSHTLILKSVDETQHAAALLAHCLEAGSVVALDGDLGAGKTHFIQGLAEGLDVQQPVTSPTFNVMSVYSDGELPLYHFDLYRLEETSELEDIGFYDYVESDGVSAIEWASKFEDEIPEEALWITISTNEDGSRMLTAESDDVETDAKIDSWFALL